MTDRARIKIAALVTTLFLAAVCVGGLVVHGNQVTAASAPRAAALGHTTQSSPVPNWNQEHD